MSQGKLSFKDLLNPVSTSPNHTTLSYVHASSNDELEAEVMASLPRLLESSSTFTQNSDITNDTRDSLKVISDPMPRPIHVTLPPSGAHLPPIKSIILEAGHHASGDDIPRYSVTNTITGMTRNNGVSSQVGEGEATTTHQHQSLRSTTTPYPPNINNHNAYVLTQAAALSRPAYYPSKPPSHNRVAIAQGQSSPRMVYPRLSSAVTSSYSTGHSVGYGPRPVVAPSPGQPYSRMNPSYGNNVVTTQGMDPVSHYQSQYHAQQARSQLQQHQQQQQPHHQHQLPVTSTQQYLNQYQTPRYSSYMQSSPSPQHTYGQYASTIGGVNYYSSSSHQTRRSTSSSMIAPAPPAIATRTYYEGPLSIGPYQNHYGIHPSSAGAGSEPDYQGGGTSYQTQVHPVLVRKTTDAPPRSGGGPYIMPSGPLPDSTSMLRSCANCGTRETPSWRRCGPEQTILCNACGLYYNEHKRHRQFRVNADGRTRAVRSPKFKLIDGDRCPECTVRGGEVASTSFRACGTCQYIRQQQNDPSADPSPPPSASSSVRDGESDSECGRIGGITCGSPGSPIIETPFSSSPETLATFNLNTTADQNLRSDSAVDQ